MRNTVIKIITLLLAILLVAGSVACKKNSGNNADVGIKDTDIVLAENGKSDYKILLSEKASEAEVYAAEKLAEKIYQATAAQIVSVYSNEPLDVEKKYLSIGKTNVAKTSGLTFDESELTCEGYKVNRLGNTVILCGSEDIGTIYSVYEFLNAQFGYEVYASDEEYIDTVKKSYLKDFNIIEIPDFWGREMDGYLANNSELNVALRMRSSNLGVEKFGYGSSQDWIPNNCHTFAAIIDPAIYDNPVGRPETYKPGWITYTVKPSGNYVNLCLTNGELKKEFADNLWKMIEENPRAKIVNMSEEDFTKWCSCENCRKDLENYGKSGYLVRFCNEIINDLENRLDGTYPERELVYTTFAYTASGSVVPPVDQLSDGSYQVKDPSCVPHQKLYIRFAPLDPACYYHSFTDDDCKINAVIKQNMEGWRSITDRFMIWDYDANYSAFFAFNDTFNSLQENLKYYKEIGIKNIFRENTTGSAVRSFGALNAYIISELMWDVEADLNGLIDNFMENYYKSGAEYMKKALEMLRTHTAALDLRESGYHAGCYDGVNTETWPLRLLQQVLEMIEKADDTYDSLKISDPVTYNKLHLRVLRESVCVRWVILELYYSKTSAYYVKMLDEFEKDAEITGATTYREHMSTRDWIQSKRG